MEKPLTVGRLAEETGLSRKAIRYYEKEKLIPRANRSSSGYRHYDRRVIERLQFIRKAKSIGFSLDDIRRVLELTDRGKPCCEGVFEWSDRRMKELDEQIRFLQGLRRRIRRYQTQWKREPAGPKVSAREICGLIARVEVPHTAQEAKGAAK